VTQLQCKVPAVQEQNLRWKNKWLRWKVKVGNKSWTGLNGMERGGNNGMTHVCKLDDIRGENQY